MSVWTTPRVKASRPAIAARSDQPAIARRSPRMPAIDRIRDHPARPWVVSAYATTTTSGRSPAGPLAQKPTATSP
jgi:hypothetical protein